MNDSPCDTSVIIVGGGPAGLMLAIELGCRGVPCVVLEDDLEPPNFPKANATSARSMEHYRRRGFAHKVRATGLLPDTPQDITYCTTFSGKELTRFRIPSRQQVTQRSAFGDYGEEQWPTPELPHRGQQMYIEAVLREEVKRYPSVRFLLGHLATEMVQTEGQITISGHAVGTQAPFAITAPYVVGCDGPRSLVRKTLGIRYSGQSEDERDFFGGQMLSIYLRSSNLYRVLNKPAGWMYWAINPVQRGLLISINGVDEFLFGVQLKPGQTLETVDVKATLFAAVGAPFDVAVIATSPWHAGFTLVADRMSSHSGGHSADASAHPRAFIAGDAAHLFTPTGGMGYNTSVDDAVNLGWKLAAVCQGWASPRLLASYDLERRPIAQRNTHFAKTMADSVGKIPIPPTAMRDDPEGEAAREMLGAALYQHVRNEFNIPGLALGLRYEGSPVVAQEAGEPPPDHPNVYQPSGRPGGRAPHFWHQGQSIFDAMGQDFTLLALHSQATRWDASAWQQAAQTLGIPLSVLPAPSAEGHALYGADLALIRPDHHIAWRGALDADAQLALAVLGKAVGR